MSERDVLDNESKMRLVGRIILDIPRRVTEPSKQITDEGERRKARFLSVALFAATTVYPILQITSEMTMGFPFYSVSAIFFAGLYILSRTDHVNLTTHLTIAFATLFPFVILIANPVWNAHNLAFQIMSWPVFAVLLGSQLLDKKRITAMIFLINPGLVIISYLHPGIALADSLEFIAVSFAIQILLGFTTWTSEYYSEKIEESKRTIESRRRELEIYTSLLRHDLANDIQMVLGGLELAQMSSEGQNKKHLAFIESTLAAAERMRSLIHIFSLTEDELDNDFITVLQTISRRAEIAFKGLTVNIDVDTDINSQKFYYGKLTALAFENLLRNTAQHAGDRPTVQIQIKQSASHLDILFEDNGPGVNEKIRNQLFGRGVTTGSKGRGLGLYLTRAIIESEGGTIELIDYERPGCRFNIKLPT